MKSFRFQFIDQDESYTISTTASPVKGFMVVRAPKGLTEATYFEYGNQKAIEAMIGLPNAHWPDIQEAIEFNKSYGLYISAPAGTSEEYPSYYGGAYLTTKGLFNYWHVSDPDEPNYEIQLKPGLESVGYDESYTDSVESIELINVKPEQTGVIVISNIAPALFQRVSSFTMKFWEDKTNKISEGQEIDFVIENNKVFPVMDGKKSEVQFGFVINDVTKTLILGATARSIVEEMSEEAEPKYKYTLVNYGESQGLPHLDFTKLFNYSELADSEGGEGEELNKITDDSNDGIGLLSDLILNGSSNKFKLYDSKQKNKSKEFSPFEGVSSRIYWKLNVKSDCFLRISQKSPNENPTSITISNIGYDKYIYDYNLKYVSKKFFDESVNPSAASAASGLTSDFNEKEFLKNLLASNPYGILDVINEDSDSALVEPLGSDLHTIWQYNSTTDSWTNITPDLKTKRFLVSGALKNDNGVDWSANPDNKSLLEYTIWTIVEAKTNGESTIYKNSLDGTYLLKKDINYDTVKISCKEEVYPGTYTSGGEFTGSLSEVGLDSAGKKIYWPFVLPEESVSFIRVDPVHTLEELGVINDKGFFIGEKIVDPIGPAVDSYTFSIYGQRYCKHINDENIKNGMLGSAWVDGYEAIIKDGLIEAQGQEYDDAYIFMEPTGQEVFKGDLMALRQTYQQLSTIISPKIISKGEFLNPDKIVVNGRSTGVAQYVGEFKVYDSYTGKYYWCQPIGSVGAMLARIIDKRLGGVAPAGTNDTQGLGGVLARPVVAARWNFGDSQLEKLENKALNPITFDSTYGLMIQGQRTTQDPDNKTDWSYLGHSMSFDLCKREIRDTVMTQQVHKRVNDYWFDIRERQVKAILDKRLVGKDPIWATAEVDIAGANTPATMAQRKFMIKVKVKVYVYSDYVVLTFVNKPQE